MNSLCNLTASAYENKSCSRVEHIAQIIRGKIIYVIKQLELNFCHIPGLKSLANFTLTIESVAKYVTSSSAGALELCKKFSVIRKVINPLPIFEFAHMLAVKEKREEFNKEALSKKRAVSS